MLSDESFIDSNLLDIKTSILSPDTSSSVSISAPTNCFDSAVKKSAGGVIKNPFVSKFSVCWYNPLAPTVNKNFSSTLFIPLTNPPAAA